MRSGWAALGLVGLALLAGGCDSCGRLGKVARAHTKSPEKSVVEDAVQKRLEKARELASQLCGVPTGGLANLELTVEEGHLGSSRVTVRGTPLPVPTSSASASGPPPSSASAQVAAPSSAASASPAPSPSAGSPADVALCAGILYVFMSPEVADDGTVSSWKLGKVEVEQVTTPGHEWKKPPEHHDHD